MESQIKPCYKVDGIAAVYRILDILCHILQIRISIKYQARSRPYSWARSSAGQEKTSRPYLTTKKGYWSQMHATQQSAIMRAVYDINMQLLLMCSCVRHMFYKGE